MLSEDFIAYIQKEKFSARPPRRLHLKEACLRISLLAEG